MKNASPVGGIIPNSGFLPKTVDGIMGPEDFPSISPESRDKLVTYLSQFDFE